MHGLVAWWQILRGSRRNIQDPSVNACVEGVYPVNLNNGSAVRLTSGNDIPGDYSPDGSKIVFGRYDANGNGLALYIINANGTGLHRLITEIFQPVNDGSWSPHGDQIVFWRHVTASVPGSIWVINSDGTGVRSAAPGSRRQRGGRRFAVAAHFRL